MDVIQTSIPGVVIIEPNLFGDHRGFFLETFQAERYASHGIYRPFVQDICRVRRAGWCAGSTSRIPIHKANR
jgi:dTDP-4-dehydrorhamnose 3,5-epimerase-like enzyme